MIKGQLFITPSFFSHVDAAAQSQALSVDVSGIVSVDADSVVTHYGQTKLQPSTPLFGQFAKLNNPHLVPFL